MPFALTLLAMGKLLEVKSGKRNLLLIQLEFMFLFFLTIRESEGVFRYGSYHRETDDLRAVVQYFLGEKRSIAAIVGHSKGMLLLYIVCMFLRL